MISMLVLVAMIFILVGVYIISELQNEESKHLNRYSVKVYEGSRVKGRKTSSKEKVLSFKTNFITIQEELDKRLLRAGIERVELDLNVVARHINETGEFISHIRNGKEELKEDNKKYVVGTIISITEIEE